MEAKAKLFRNGRSQAVRIPKAFQFKGIGEVVIRKEGDTLVLAPARKTWRSYASEAPSIDDDFMAARPDLLNPTDTTT